MVFAHDSDSSGLLRVFFEYGFDLTEIFGCRKISTLSLIPRSQTSECHCHYGVKFSGFYGVNDAKVDSNIFSVNFSIFFSPF